MDRINIQNLAMFITNKYNLNSNDIDMSKKTINQVFIQTSKINNLHIYGGEPVLAIDNLEYMFRTVIANNVKIRKVDVTIGGTTYDENFLRLLDYINHYLKYCHGSKVRLSILKGEKHKKKLKKLGLYKQSLLYTKEYMDSKYFYKLCKEPTIVTKASKFSNNYVTYMNKIKMFDEENGVCNIGPIVTINPNGIITKANATFEEQQTLYNYGNVNNDSIEEIMLKNSQVLKPMEWYKKIKVIR